ncbi:MAG: hypothetical protein HFH93_02295 [Lachnospiraceae bacterium]|nr:hypothetical protein [Lachnospiraceae bacterium]
MKKGTCKVMALCDTEEEYAQLMTEFMEKRKNLPWELHTYTNVDRLLGAEKKGLAMLVVAESAYRRELEALSPECLVVLNESGVMRWEDVSYVDKYQEAEEVFKQLLGVYTEVADVQLPFLRSNRKTVFIGNYSPVHRSMQTSFAITMSLMLARKHSTLYLNFEHYAGISELLPDMQTLDMADLLYFLNAQRDKFRLRLQTILKRKGALDYVPPMKSGQNLITVTAQEWLGLLERIEELDEYEYVVLDLSESMQGLFEILRMCRQVYTLTREDRIAQGKLLQYEQVLALYEYGDVLGKTKRLSLSHIQKLPGEMEQLTKGEVADLVKGLIKGLEEGGDE